MGILLLVILFIVVVVVLIDRRLAAMTPAALQRSLEERRASLLTFEYGPINPILTCPYCRKKGHIRTKRGERKQGVSGAQAPEAILAGEVSRKEQVTRAYCDNCEGTWEL